VLKLTKGYGPSVVRAVFSKVKKVLPLIGIGIFFYLLYSMNLNDVYAALRSVHPMFILAALSLTLPRVLIRTSAWYLIQKEQRITISFFHSMKIFLMGYFYGSITPGYLGQLMRVPYLKERTNEHYGKLFVNSTIETIVHTFSMFGMILVGATLVLQTIPELFTFSIMWLIFLVLILLYFLKKERGERFFHVIINHLLPASFRSNAADFVNTFYNEFPRLRKLILPFLLGILTWIIIFSQEYIIVFAMGIPIPYAYFLLLFPVANAAGFLPITFGGLGTRELTSIMLFSTLFGVQTEQIFVFTVLGFLITDIFTGVIGFLVSLTEARTTTKLPLK
jgi:uncharacterized protein (TIRG00374 family)